VYTSRRDNEVFVDLRSLLPSGVSMSSLRAVYARFTNNLSSNLPLSSICQN